MAKYVKCKKCSGQGVFKGHFDRSIGNGCTVRVYKFQCATCKRLFFVRL